VFLRFVSNCYCIQFDRATVGLAVLGFAVGNLAFGSFFVLSLLVFTRWLARAKGENHVTLNGHSLCFVRTFIFGSLGGLQLLRKWNSNRHYDNRGAGGIAAQNVSAVFVRTFIGDTRSNRKSSARDGSRTSCGHDAAAERWAKLSTVLVSTPCATLAVAENRSS
jgi:hypothetical protein